MKGKSIIFSIAALVVLVAVCMPLNTGSVQAAQAGDVFAKGTYDKAVSMLGQSSGSAPRLISIDRTRLVDNIYKYSFIFKVGDGEFDKIGVYRVVKERRSWVAIMANKAVMMVHGDTSDFDSEFLMSTMSDKVSVYHSLGIYLAQNDIDVWGVDRRWTFVPDDTEHFSFMENWDTALHLADLKLGVKFARIIRGLTWSGWGKIFMLGHSRGAALAYAYANEETQAPEWRRDLRGIIPVDMVYKFDPAETELIGNACDRYFIYKFLYDSGTYYSDQAQQMKGIAYLAATAPDDPSPIIPGLKNKEAALLALSATYLISEQQGIPPEVPFYHYCAGIFDGELPTGLQFTNYDYMLDFAFAVPSFQSLGEMIDGEALWCSDDTAYDDHLAEITIPVLYVGAAGGFGAYGEYTLELLGTSDTDKQSLIVQLWPEGYEVVDYGHIDLMFADNAETLVWQPIYNWIMDQ
jgi:pimeloyl-ACP methyl ester carboxylesterase